MDVSSLKKGVAAGTVTAEQLLELLLQQMDVSRRLMARVELLEARLAKYEPPPPPTDSGAAASDFSVAAEEQRRRVGRKRQKSPRRGRVPTADKLAEAKRIDDVYPPNAQPSQCVVVRTRVAWRIENGRAIRVGYRIHKRKFRNDAPRVPGLLPHGEFGLEIVVLLAFLVYIVRVSLDQACVLLKFFCQLPIEKSQADALLNQLARQWRPEFDTLCELLALAVVVSLDETSWKLGREGCSLWLFQSAQHLVLKFGCRKDAKTLEQMLPRDVFRGTAVSDDATVYQRRFDSVQKCWAHLLRKAIQLALLYPEKPRYRTFLDDLLSLYREAKRSQADGRLSDAGRAAKVELLEGRLWDVCSPHEAIWTAPCSPAERDFSNLVHELFRLLEANELFTFVVRPGVEPTNNVSERGLRGPALDRKTGRASKTAAGAARRSVIQSVLESLRKNLPGIHLERGDRGNHRLAHVRPEPLPPPTRRRSCPPATRRHRLTNPATTAPIDHLKRRSKPNMNQAPSQRCA